MIIITNRQITRETYLIFLRKIQLQENILVFILNCFIRKTHIIWFTLSSFHFYKSFEMAIDPTFIKIKKFICIEKKKKEERK